MKITKTIEGNITTYYYNNIKKYEHYKDSNGDERRSESKDGNDVYIKDNRTFEYWSESKDGKEIHFKNNRGYERWSDDNPENPKNKQIAAEDVKPFEFINFNK